MLGDQHRVHRRTSKDAVEDESTGADHVSAAGMHVRQRLALLDQHREQSADRTLDRVGPDVHQLLEVLQDVRLAIQGVPGFRMLRRRA